MPLHGKLGVLKALAEVPVEANNRLRAMVLLSFGNIIKGTPVGNPDLWVYNHPTRGYIDYVGYFGKPDYVGGRARNNWYLTSVLPSDKTNDKTTGNSASVVTKDLPKNIMNKKMYLTNNLPYVVPLEYGHSTQAPEGWVRAEMIRLQNRIRKL